MAIDPVAGSSELLTVLRTARWTELVPAIYRSAEWLENCPVGSAQAQLIFSAMSDLARHEKWEVRRALALAAGTSRHASFDDVLARLAADPNARVQHAAEASSLRRRDWRTAGLLGREHEQRLDRVLEQIHARFGSSGRVAVRRAANEMVSTFAHELYHEVIKHLTPLDRELEQLRDALASDAPKATLDQHVRHAESDLAQAKAVLMAMRQYTATPELRFSTEPLGSVVDQAVRTIIGRAESVGIAVENRVSRALVIDISRVRVVQAVSNILNNALEAYDGIGRTQSIVVEAVESETAVTLFIRDHGCGMSSEAQADALTLFHSTKPNGTGVGLPLAAKIIESEHDGRVEIQSSEGVGTTIALTLPRYHRSEL